ncbi:11841_t:CDS:1, partial [Racocetra persica]
QLEQIEQAEKEQKDKEKESEQEIKELNKQIEKINQQKPTSIAAKKIEREIRDAEQKANQSQHEYIEQQ